MSQMFYILVLTCFLNELKNSDCQMFGGGYGMFNSQYDYNPYSMYGGGYGGGYGGMNTMNSMNSMGSMASMGSMGSMNNGYNNMLLNPYMDSMSSMGGMNGYGAMTPMANPMGAAMGGMGGMNGLGSLAMSPYSAYGGYGMGNSNPQYYNNGLSFTNYGNSGNPYGRINSFSKTYGTPSNNNLNGLQATGSGGSYRSQPSGNCGGRKCAWETIASKN